MVLKKLSRGWMNSTVRNMSIAIVTFSLVSLFTVYVGYILLNQVWYWWPLLIIIHLVLISIYTPLIFLNKESTIKAKLFWFLGILFMSVIIAPIFWKYFLNQN
jgi:hypothetical protein